jgi:cytoskeletal protein CcmA (bactofilin family)
MLNFSRAERPTDTKGNDARVAVRPASPQPVAGIVPPPAAKTPEPAAPVPTEALAPPRVAEASGSRLSVGVDINLKGVEISNCGVLVIEGNVEATVNSKAMEIARPGRLNGTANIEVAEVHGEFSGELTARSRLVVHGTGRVTGTIRYGLLVVEEGGVVSGELQQLETAKVTSAPVHAPAPAPIASTPGSRALLGPQP